MRMPIQTAPARRGPPSAAAIRKSGVRPQAACDGVPVGTLGRCYFDDANPVDRYNCTACCALRHAVAWMPPNGPVINC